VCDQRGHLLCRPVGCPPDPGTQFSDWGFGLGNVNVKSGTTRGCQRLSTTIACGYKEVDIGRIPSRLPSHSLRGPLAGLTTLGDSRPHPALGGLSTATDFAKARPHANDRRSNISTAIVPMAAEYGWSKALQGAVLSAFFAGYCITQLVGGQLADTMGAKHVLTVGVVSWSVCTVLTPLGASLGIAPLIAGANDGEP